jgi:hypothetical protein
MDSTGHHLLPQAAIMIVMTGIIRAAAPTMSKHRLCATVKVMMFVSQQQRPAL